MLSRIGVVILTVLVLNSCSDKSTENEQETDSHRLSLGVVRESWSLASPPMDPMGAGDLLPTRGLHDPACIWFNPYDQFTESEIYDVDVSRSPNDRRTHVLVTEARPWKSQTRLPEQPNTAAWAGVMRGLPIAAWDQSQAKYLDLRLAVVQHGTSAGIMRIDLGRISEDINGNKHLDTEDLPMVGGLPGNRILDDGEDVGLDMTPDSLEVSIDGTPYDPISNSDPAGDNWFYDNDTGTRNSYDHINGTENSVQDPVRGMRPDAEDIGGESQFDQTNAYYEFAINLDDPLDPALVQNSEKVSGDVTGFADELVWKTYRIPMWDAQYYRAFADPGIQSDLTQIEFARLWLSGADSTVRIYIAEMSVVDSTGM